MNTGKKFEQAFKLSVPKEYLLYRLPDPAQSFSGNSKIRFSLRNPFDYLMWVPDKRALFALELKTVSGKSISFERSKEELGEIHDYQIDGLNKWSKYDGVVCGFIIEFRKTEQTIFINIHEFNKLADMIAKKSFSINDLENNGIEYIIISQTKIRTRYKYDIKAFIDEVTMGE